MFSKFYNGTIRRMVVAFGSLFNEIYIDRAESGGTKTLLVPISYAPKEKYKVRLAGDPSLQNPNQIVLPRMAFEITGYMYDGLRKRNSTSKFLTRDTNPVSGVDYTFSEVPYNLDFGLYVYVRNMDDGLRIIEQIIPNFAPEFVVSINFDSIRKSMDVPIYLNSVSSEEDYEGDFTSRRSIIFTLNFTMKTYLFGPKKNYKEIRSVQTSFMNANIFDDDYTGATSDWFLARDIIGVSGPGATVGNYEPYLKIYEKLSGGGTTYAAGMAAGGLTVDWNF